MPRARPCAGPRRREQQGHVAAEKHDDRRNPQPVRVGEVAEVIPTARPVRRRPFLGDRGVRHEAAEVGHAKCLVHERQRERGDDELDAGPHSGVPPLHREDEGEEREAEQHELGADEPTQSERERLWQREGALRRCGPAREDPEARTQPRERQARLEAAGREDPHREDRHQHQHPERDGEGVVDGQHGETSGAAHRQPQRDERQREPENDGDPLEPERRGEIGNAEDGDPQRTGERLDAFARVEHRTVADANLTHDPQVDEAVVDHHAMRPRGRGEQGARDHEDGGLEPTPPTSARVRLRIADPLTHRHDAESYRERSVRTTSGMCIEGPRVPGVVGARGPNLRPQPCEGSRR